MKSGLIDDIKLPTVYEYSEPAMEIWYLLLVFGFWPAIPCWLPETSNSVDYQ